MRHLLRNLVAFGTALACLVGGVALATIAGASAAMAVWQQWRPLNSAGCARALA